MADEKSYPLTFAERALAAISPAWALQRVQSRHDLTQFEYNAATPGKLRGGSGGVGKQGSPESYTANRNRQDLMWDARDMEKNFPFIAGVLERTAMYTVGSLTYKSATGDKAIDAEYEDYFHGWCGRSDPSGRYRFREQIELAFRSMLRDGDYGFRIVDEGGPEIQVQGIEADRIGSPIESTQRENYIGGLTIGEKGIIEKVDIYRRSRTNQYSKEMEINGAEFLHLVKPIRAEQYRGVTWLAPVLAHARDLHEIFGFEKQGAKTASMWSGFIYDRDPMSGQGGWDTNPQTGQKELKAEAGLIQTLRKNTQDIKFAPGVQRPSGAFMNLFEVAIKQIAIGLNLPYGFVYDMAAFGGVTSRIEAQQAQRVFRRFQTLLQDRVIDTIKNLVLARGIISGRIPAHSKFREGSWRFGSQLTADIQHQTTADILLIDKGLSSRTRWCEEHDLDFEKVQEEFADEMIIMRDIAVRKGIPIELMHDAKPQATEMLAAMAAKDDEPTGPAPMIESAGDSGVKPLLAILEQVGEGSMDRESGIAAIMEIYGLDYARASRMVPAGPAPLPGVDRPGMVDETID
jgi:capsid protein